MTGTMIEVRVIYQRDEETWVARSPDVPHWTAEAGTYAECRRLAEEGVRFALDRADVSVEHFVAESELASLPE